MNGKLYNNLGICSLSIAFTLQNVDFLSLSRVLLIMPIIAHEELLNYMARKTTDFKSIEQIIVRKPECFLNFNARFYDGLTISLNAIQFLSELALIKLENGNIISIESLNYEKSMGERAKKIFSASPRIAEFVGSDTANLYTNLRIEL
ncbi:MAG: three component ABC system middle component [Nitrososphaeraceae archaeon]